MPIYEYECDACGHRFETIQKFSDPPVETCPSCGRTVHKLQSAPAFQFKGTGWYVTDYAKTAETQASKDTRKSDTDAAKADAKPDGQTARKEGASDTHGTSQTVEKSPSSSSSSSGSAASGPAGGTTGTGSPGPTGAKGGG